MINLDRYKVERGRKIKVSDLTRNNYNPNKTTERVDEAIRESLEHYGQVLEILVRPDPDNKGKYIIIDGEHRFNHADKEVYVNVIHGLSESDAKKLTVILNETRGKADELELSELLAGLDMDREELKIGLPYDDQELADLIKMADSGFSDSDLTEEEQPRLDESKFIECPECGHKFTKD